jgi:hypothetical protein
MAVSIRRLASGHPVRCPHIAVFRIATPGAVAVEILIPDDVWRNIARGRRVIVAAVAGARSTVEIVIRLRHQRFVV